MKILFVENRYCTRIWAEVGKRLERHGHAVAHMVQNPVFAPRDAQCFVLPFPSMRVLQNGKIDDSTLTAMLRSDRAVRYWGVTTAHYAHYLHEIKHVFDVFKPDVVFGEPTQFHEMLTIETAKQRGIPFLFPSSTRYPSGRIVFLKDDTMESVGGEGKMLPYAQALALKDQIVSRRSVPSYMVNAPDSAFKKFKTRVADKALVTLGWLKGERYVTPSPMAKLKLEKEQTLLVKQWEQLAVKALPSSLKSQPWVLYAMQMQPESNLDVWGSPWNDQAALISRAAQALEKMGAALVVKPNPKSKYELNTALLDVVGQHKNVHVLSHASKMADVFPGATAVMSVTGTVILECVMAGKPVGVLGNHALAELPGVTRIAAPEDMAELVVAVQNSRAIRASEADAVAVLQEFYASSYPGVLYEPLSQSDRATPENLETISAGFISVLTHFNQRSEHVLRA